jgi:hypothetical protein
LATEGLTERALLEKVKIALAAMTNSADKNVAKFMSLRIIRHRRNPI